MKTGSAPTNRSFVERLRIAALTLWLPIIVLALLPALVVGAASSEETMLALSAAGGFLYVGGLVYILMQAEALISGEQDGIDLPKLAEELGRLRAAMEGESTGAPEHDEAIGAVAGAEKAAARGDGPTALQYLKSADEWTLGIAEKIGVGVAIEALKEALKRAM